MLTRDTSNATVIENKVNHRASMEGKEERRDLNTKEVLHVLVHGQKK